MTGNIIVVYINLHIFLDSNLGDNTYWVHETV